MTFKPNPNLEKQLADLVGKQVGHIEQAANSDDDESTAARRLRKGWQGDGGTMSAAEARRLVRGTRRNRP